MKIFTATFKFKGSDGLGYFKDRIYRLNICDGLFVGDCFSSCCHS